MELSKKQLRKLKDALSNGISLRITLVNTHPDASIYVVNGWDTFEASWDSDATPLYFYAAFFSERMARKVVEDLMRKRENEIADRYLVAATTVVELHRGNVKSLSPGSVDAAFASLETQLG